MVVVYNNMMLMQGGGTPKLLTPAMTSMSTPSGQVLCNITCTSTLPAWLAFDQSTSSILHSQDQISGGSYYLGYAFPKPHKVTSITFLPRNDEQGYWYTRCCGTYKTQYSDDGSNWYDFDTFTITSASLSHTLTNPRRHKYWRWMITSFSTNWYNLAELYIYGV